MNENRSDYAMTPFQGIDALNQSEVFLGERALQQVKTTYTTAVAVQKPRSIERVANNVLMESKLAGSNFYYRWEVKNKRTGQKSIVQGASIDLAMCIARNFGNCVVDVEASETPTHYMIKGIFVDLETGFTVPRLYRQRKNQDIGGGYGADRAEDVVFQIAQSKAQRNAIIKAMPSWLVEKCIEVAREAEVSQIKPENLVMARAKVLEFFGKYGISLERIEDKVERQIDMWTAEDIVDLRAAATALKEGRITANELFPTDKQDERDTEDLESRILKGNGGQQQQDPPPEKDTSATEETPSPAELPWYDPSFWYNLKSPGFTTYCENNAPRMHEIPDNAMVEYLDKNWKIVDALREKWNRIYHGEKVFPGDPEPNNDGAGEPSGEDESPFQEPDDLSDAHLMNFDLEVSHNEQWIEAGIYLNYLPKGFQKFTPEDPDPRGKMTEQSMSGWNSRISRLVDATDN